MSGNRAESTPKLKDPAKNNPVKAAEMIADQPTLKALMSTNDRPTVQDASGSILLRSRADLLILENPRSELLALHTRYADVTAAMSEPLLKRSSGEEDWWFINGHLYNVSFVPVIAGNGLEERVLGRMALGRDIKNDSILANGAYGRSEFIFERGGAVLLSSLPADVWAEAEAALEHHGQHRLESSKSRFMGNAMLPAPSSYREITRSACTPSSLTIGPQVSCKHLTACS